MCYQVLVFQDLKLGEIDIYSDAIKDFHLYFTLTLFPILGLVESSILVKNS